MLHRGIAAKAKQAGGSSLSVSERHVSSDHVQLDSRTDISKPVSHEEVENIVFCCSQLLDVTQFHLMETTETPA